MSSRSWPPPLLSVSISLCFRSPWTSLCSVNHWFHLAWWCLQLSFTSHGGISFLKISIYLFHFIYTTVTLWFSSVLNEIIIFTFLKVSFFFLIWKREGERERESSCADWLPIYYQWPSIYHQWPELGQDEARNPELTPGTHVGGRKPSTRGVTCCLPG